MLHYRLDGVRWPDEEQWLPALELSFFLRKGAEGWLQGYSVGAGLSTWRMNGGLRRLCCSMNGRM